MKRLSTCSLVFVAILFAAGNLLAINISGTISTDTTLDLATSRIWQVTGNITVQNGVTLTIEPGVVLKFNDYTNIYVHGTLHAVGGPAAEDLIYFTSIHDDNAPAPLGDDTNGNGNTTVPSREKWGTLRFYNDSNDASILQHCIISYGGYSNTGIIYCDNASPTVEDCEINAGQYGVICIGASAPVLRNTAINAMEDVPIAIEISANPVFDNLAFESTSDNGYDAIGILGGTLTGNNILGIRGAQLGATPIDNFVYILLANVTISASGSLTIDPGVVVKPRSNVYIYVDGGLWMDGTADPDSQIVFTSYKDDNYGTPGDTNNNGSIDSPAVGDWRSIYFREGSSGSVSYATLRFASYSTEGVLRTYNCSPPFSHLTISDVNYGIESAGISASAISDCMVSNTVNTPFLMSVSANPTFSGNSFTNVGISAIGLIGETIGVDSVVRVRTVAGFDNITYWLNNSLTMSIGANLRFEPGIVLKMNNPSTYPRIFVDGSLTADATPDSQIVFTSQYDDTWGNPSDTESNGTSTTPNVSQWGYIKFRNDAVDAKCILDECVFSYGGYDYSYYYTGVVWCESASPTISNCEFIANRTGIRTDGLSAPLIEANHFLNNTQVPLATSVVSDPTYLDNTFNQNEYHAVGILSETLAEDAVLEVVRVGGPPQFDEYFPYLHLGTLTIGTGAGMRTEPGVIVKVLDSQTPIIVNGGLMMNGTADSMIVYTAIKDDSFGGDTNTDGSDTSPGTGNWYNIKFNSTSDDTYCSLDHCLLRFGGATDGVVNIQSASPSITNNDFEINTWGLWIQNASAPVVEGNLFRLIDRVPIAKSVLATPTFSGNVYDNNGNDALGLIGEHIAQDLTVTTWDVAGYTNITRVLVGSYLEIDLGAVLTIDPGVVLKMGPWSTYPWFVRDIIVKGAIKALGTEAEPVVFTSIRDDAYGMPADTNNDGSLTSPSTTDWSRLYIEDVSDDVENVYTYTIFRYGGYSGGTVQISTASPTFNNCLFEHNYYYGLQIDGDSSPLVNGCTFGYSSKTPIALSLISDPVFTGNHFLDTNTYSALGILGENLAQDAYLPVRSMAQTRNIPYVLLSDLTAGLSSILTIQPGVVIKSEGAKIIVKRGLIAEGTAEPDSLIVFTSTYDDFYGGDTNNDGSDHDGFDKRWGYVQIDNEAIDSETRFDNCVFRFAYNSSSYGALNITNANPQISNCIFTNNAVGINYNGSAGDPTKGAVHGCDIYANTYFGIKNTGMSFVIDATDNWWGSASGPYDESDDTGAGGWYNPAGLGDKVTDKVDYSSWQTDGIENLLLGDVSQNGQIHAYDASLTLQDFVGAFLTPRQIMLSDVDCSGIHSTLDASLILRFVAELDTYFPCAYENTPTKNIPVVMTRYPGSEPGNFQVQMPGVTVGPGRTETVAIGLSGEGELLGQYYRILFDPQAVTIADVALLPAAAGAMLAWNVPTAGELRIALASQDFLPVQDAVAISFRGADTLTGEHTVDVELVQAILNEQEILDTTGAPGPDLPAARFVAKNFPNPFNPSTSIAFGVPVSAAGGEQVLLRVYDLSGRLLRVLADEFIPSGYHSREWDGRDTAGRRVGSGVYFYRADIGPESFVNKMVMLK